MHCCCYWWIVIQKRDYYCIVERCMFASSEGGTSGLSEAQNGCEIMVIFIVYRMCVMLYVSLPSHSLYCSY